MPSAAPRIEIRLVRALARLDDDTLPVAETNRRVGRRAEELGLPRPSYEQVRSYVRELRMRRELRRRRRAAVRTALADVAYRARGPDVVLEAVLDPRQPTKPDRRRR